MIHPSNTKEKVGSEFQSHLLRSAQSRAWEALRKTAQQIKPGHTEKEALLILKDTLTSEGVEKIWHPPQIRFGVNTTKAFGVPSEKDVVLQENDLFFLDIGPVFDGYEGDVGETYVVGRDPLHMKIAEDAKLVFDEVKTEWKTNHRTGASLYEFAQERAHSYGWDLSLEGASGHRVSEFPHAVHYRGKLRVFEDQPSPDRWILEIHLFDKQKRFGAFFEDLL